MEQGQSPITVAVADRHHLIRRALARLVAAEPGFALAGDCGDLGGARRILDQHRPRALLLEPRLLGRPGLAGLGELMSRSPKTSVVVLADDLSPALRRHAARHGAAAAVLKDAPPDELFAVLRDVARAPAPSPRRADELARREA